ncbi:MAG: glutaredoxin [Oscillospiraceae bacterium]|nr:glutaredoxin [Oscillospiraceae bacterium]
MLIMLGSKLCPDCREAMDKLNAAGAEYVFADISENLANLKMLLRYRDTSADYAKVRSAGSIGIPCFVRDDGTVTRRLSDVLPK